MKHYRTVLHGHVVEGRRGDLGSELVILDGRPVSRRLALLTEPSHFFDLDDESGRTRHVEARWSPTRGGLGDPVLVVSVDGYERCRLRPIDPARLAERVCPSCGYRLEGLPAENDEVRCPECGRHSPAAG